MRTCVRFGWPTVPTKEEIQERLDRYGPNRLPEEEGLSRLKILVHQFTSPLIYILLAAAIVTALLGEFIDTGVSAAVLIINAIVGYSQEYKAETSVRALKGMVVAKAYPDGSRCSYCCGFTFEAFVRAMKLRNVQKGLDPDDFNGMTLTTCSTCCSSGTSKDRATANSAV